MTMKADTRIVVTEQTPLLGDEVPCPPQLDSEQAQRDSTEPSENNISFFGILSLLLVGAFIANADTSLVLATYGQICSEFNSLNNASWLLTGYMLSMCGTQPLYGKLSNIFGRKPLLLLSYVLFALGNLLCGIGGNMITIIIGRIIGGAGGAGMSSIVSFLIADMVPVRQVAAYRSYINVVQTVGRSCGGPLGGKLAETMGWRWSFYIQVPLTLLAIALVQINLKVPKPAFHDDTISIKAQLRRIDFLGAILMCSAIVTLLLPISLGGNQLDWTHPIISLLVLAAILQVAAFVYVESRLAKEPIFPLGLLAARDVVLTYGILLLQNMAQTFMMFVVPLYFQVTANASPSAAGFYLVPAILGNTLGGLITGHYIKRTGQYKLPTNFAAIIAGLCHALMVVRWTGDTNMLESMYIFLGGLGTGIAHSSTFIAITAETTEEELAIAGAGLYLSGGLGSVSGVAVASSMMRVVFKKVAISTLRDNPAAGEIIKKSLRDVRYLTMLQGQVKSAVLNAYIWAFRANFGLACLCCAMSLAFGLFLKERRLSH